MFNVNDCWFRLAMQSYYECYLFNKNVVSLNARKVTLKQSLYIM